MSFTYSLSLRKNPLKPLLSTKAYAKAQASKVCGFDTVCHRIADRSSATVGDVKLVLDDFGRFQGQISGAGAETIKDYNSSLIRKVRLQFRPCKAFSGKFLPEVLTFKQVAKKVAVKEMPETEPGA